MNQPTFTDPTRQALSKITKARQILDEVVTSSESFDYPKAKKGLKELQKMIRELSREEARLCASFNAGSTAHVVPFPVQKTDGAKSRQQS